MRRKLPAPNGRALAADAHRRHDRFPPSFGRNAFGKFDALGRFRFHRAGDGVDQFRYPQPDRRRLTAPQAGRDGAGGGIECDDIAVAIENDGRIGQRVEKRRQRILRIVAHVIAPARRLRRTGYREIETGRGQKKDQPDAEQNLRVQAAPLHRRSQESCNRSSGEPADQRPAAPRQRVILRPSRLPAVFFRRGFVVVVAQHIAHELRRHAARPARSCRGRFRECPGSASESANGMM